MVLTSRCDAVVYVCEPGSVASITQMGEIKRVRDPTANSNSITTLFTELAVVQNYGLVVQAFGVVLSGMAGIDGVEGARELAEAGGIIIVQDPATSEFPDMPNNVIAAVADTEVRAPEAMCATIAEVMGSRPVAGDWAREELRITREICETVLSERGCDFRLYHSNMVSRRIQHCMHSSRAASLTEYAERLKVEPALVDFLVSKLLINVTSFFRDPETWALVGKEIIPQVFFNAHSFELRFWVAGCSTGEEAFTLGILLLEHLAGPRDALLIPPRPPSIRPASTSILASTRC